MDASILACALVAGAHIPQMRGSKGVELIANRFHPKTVPWHTMLWILNPWKIADCNARSQATEIVSPTINCERFGWNNRCCLFSNGNPSSKQEIIEASM